MAVVVVAPCEYGAARIAVERWHYSHVLPVGRLITFGVWEDGAFVGAVVYGRGSSAPLYKSWGLSQTEMCELVRVALTTHATPVSQIVAYTLRVLRETNPGLRLVVSFADPREGHHGGIYQAGNWTYVGRSNPTTLYIDEHGRARHARAVQGRSRDGARNDIPYTGTITAPGKHRYAYPLDPAMKRRLKKLAQPYPPRGGGVDGDAPALPVGDAGSTPAHRSDSTQTDAAP